MSYPWARRLTYQCRGHAQFSNARKPSPGPKIRQLLPPRSRSRHGYPGWNPLMARARRGKCRAGKAVTLEIPDAATEPVDFTIDMSGYDGVGKFCQTWS